ncbi:MAG TPA: hypothetical protein VFL14_10165, partial [Xanthomonadales bacterium]|nr:hypothetical protein [Xanthomonadales bacterium]
GRVIVPAFADDGRVAFRTGRTTNEVAIVGTDGAQRRLDVAQHGLRMPFARFAPDGDLVLAGFGASDGQIRVTRLAANDTTRWSTAIADRSFLWNGPAALSIFQLAFAGERVYVLVQDVEYETGNTGVGRFRLMLADLAAADGTPRWLNEPGARQYSSAFLGVDRDARPFIVGRGNQRFVVSPLDPATGAPLWQESYSCPGSSSCPLDFVAGSDGQLRVLTVQGTRFGATSLVRPLDRGPGIPAAQRGVTGAWFPAYGAGRGIVLDYFADSRTLFAPWFTYVFIPDAPLEGNLRWYSLQGTATGDSPVAELDILENGEGNFAAPPVTSARRVGSATLRFESCSLAHLEFRFDPGVFGDAPDGYRREVSLTRLTPRTEACRLADGTQQSVATTPRAGFDARQSGAWFDPATSGQGLMLTVDPQSALFGAWFTYDTPNTFDDSLHQHWLSLQADLANARDGTVVATIYRSDGAGIDGGPVARTVRVGEATLTFQSCDRLRVDYRFEGPDAGTFALAPLGTLNLQRIGGCDATGAAP